MAFEGLPAYAFMPEGIRVGAPAAPVIYAIFTPTRWVLIAEADNMRQALFRLLDAPTECMQSHHPLSFRCVAVPHSDRARQCVDRRASTEMQWLSRTREMNLDAYKQRLLVLQDNVVASTRHVGRS